VLFVSQVTKYVLETVLIKKAKQALLRLRKNDSEETHAYEFLKLSNSASFHVTFDDNGKCVPKWLGKLHLQENVQLDSVLLSWIYLLKKNKSSFFSKSVNSLFTLNTSGTEQFSDAIQIIAQMVNGMIG